MKQITQCSPVFLQKHKHILRTVWTFFIPVSQKQTHKNENCLDLFHSGNLFRVISFEVTIIALFENYIVII